MKLPERVPLVHVLICEIEAQVVGCTADGEEYAVMLSQLARDTHQGREQGLGPAGTAPKFATAFPQSALLRSPFPRATSDVVQVAKRKD